MKTIRELIQEGRIRMEGIQMRNAIVDCYPAGGIKGLWLDGRYYPVQREARDSRMEYEAFDVR